MHHFSDSLGTHAIQGIGRGSSPKSTWPVLFARVFITGGQLSSTNGRVMVAACRGIDGLRPAWFSWASRASWGLALAHSHGHQTPRCSTTAPPSTPSLRTPLPSSQNAVRGFLELITFRAVRSVQPTTSAEPANCTRCTAAKWCSASSHAAV